MQKDLYYDYQSGQDCIAETLRYCPATMDYYKWVAGLLGCEVGELGMLMLNPAFLDTQGFKLEGFFPLGKEFSVKVISKDYNCDGYSFGKIIEVTYNGEKFIAESLNSPYGVWCKYEEID